MTTHQHRRLTRLVRAAAAGLAADPKGQDAALVHLIKAATLALRIRREARGITLKEQNARVIGRAWRKQSWVHGSVSPKI